MLPWGRPRGEEDVIDFQRIYRERAEDYDRLIAAEDCDGVILPTLREIAPLRGSLVVDVGAGTGRLGRLLLPEKARVVALDQAPAMLAVARTRFPALGPRPGSWSLAVADLGALPVAPGVADLVTAGWALGHQRGWNPEGWRAAIRGGVEEMARVARRGSRLVIFETLGTGHETPAPPPGVQEVHELFAELGFEGRTLRTDYAFESVEEAARTCGFFFGDEMATRIRSEGWSRVPECTGMWVR